MTVEKGLDPAVADKIGEYVQLKGKSPPTPNKTVNSYTPPGGAELISRLKDDLAIVSSPSAKQGLEEMAILVALLRAYKILDKVRNSNRIP